jgi:hypothetical protein
MIDTLNSDHGNLENSAPLVEPRTCHLVLR